MKNEKLKKRKEKTTIICMIHHKRKMMGKIGVDRSEELKITEEEKDFENWNWKKKLKKSKTVEQRKPMHEQSSNPWNQSEGYQWSMEGRIYGNERFWGENEKVQRWWKERVVMLKLVRWGDQEKVMNQEPLVPRAPVSRCWGFPTFQDSKTSQTVQQTGLKW